MAKRKIITINEDLCNGCGDCVTACSEGALRIINGKAKLVNERFCDGFGDCIGKCPTGALKIEEKDVPDFDFEATREHVAGQGGVEAVRKLEMAAKAHELKQKIGPAMMHHGGGCPGSAMRFNPQAAAARPPVVKGGPRQAIPSELNQWPIQIHLVRPDAPFFKNRELVVLSTCAPIASADMHWRFIRGRSVVVGCPKLDRTEGYVEKLAAILSEPSIPKVIIVRMEVPCCGGLTMIVHEAVVRSGREDLEVQEVTVGLNGDILD
jgi:NAD-dependent dihydropyrimidine dehydrogenase PreA subunit